MQWGARRSWSISIHGTRRSAKKSSRFLTCPLRSVPIMTTAGGVVASLPDNSVVISNTVESRMQRAKELKRKEIHAILTGA